MRMVDKLQFETFLKFDMSSRIFQIQNKSRVICDSTTYGFLEKMPHINDFIQLNFFPASHESFPIYRSWSNIGPQVLHSL